MQEADIHVHYEAIEGLGFDVTHQQFQESDIQDVTLLHCGDQKCIAAITYSGDVDAALDNSEHVEHWERLGSTTESVTYLCRSVTPPELQETGCPEHTLAIQSMTPCDNGFSVTVVADQEALECTPAPNVLDRYVTLEKLTQYRGPGRDLESLTRRQRQVVETAFRLGYYEVPRETTADEIARHMDLDRSTVSEHLQRAEHNILSSLLSG